MDPVVPVPLEQGKPKPPDQIRDFLRVKHYSLRTEENYLGKIKRFILFHGKRLPSSLAEREMVAFLQNLASTS